MSAPQGLSILVLDDDQDIRFAQCRIIRNCGHDTFCAGTSSEAFALLESEQIDVVFCDLRIPGDNLSCSEIIHHIQQHWPDTKIVVVSCMMDYDIRELLTSQGVSACLRKPIFEAHVEHVIEKIQPELSALDAAA
jgi:CheY-like chemotaxis protein